MDAFFFWLFSLGMIVGGLAVVLNRNPVASLMCFVVSIACMSGLFILLSAFFLATIELLVTAGAVMVLFLFVIMLLDVTAAEKIPRQKTWMACSLVLCLGFLLNVARTLDATPQGAVTIANAPGPRSLSPEAMSVVSERHPRASEGFLSDLGDDTHRIGYLLFRTNTEGNETSYVAPFEITSLLILVATVGVIVLCKQDDRKRPSPREEIAREAPPIEPKKETALTR